MEINPSLTDDCHTDPSILDPGKLPLTQLIPLIVQQKGAFVDITEESLLEEIGNGQSLVEPKDADSEAHLDFFKEKNHIIQLVKAALNETSLSLDFVSLLVSASRPSAGSASMSPHLKNSVNLGTLATSEVPPPEEDEQRDLQTGFGWKQEGLEKCARDLKSASERLTKEVAKEKNYWKKITSVIAKKEILVKVNGAGETSGAKNHIGVKYGFKDSGSLYHDRGIGLLEKESSNGDILLRRSNVAEKVCKAVSISIYERRDDEMVRVGCSDISSLIPRMEPESDEEESDSSSASITTQIDRARFFLFEEELMFFLVREAKDLIPYQVNVVSNNKLSIDLHDRVIEIEGILVDDDAFIVQDRTDLPECRKADLLGSFLRLMLCSHHRENLELKRTPPAPLSSGKGKSQNVHPQPLLLKPLIGYIRHNAHKEKVTGLLQRLFQNSCDGEWEKAFCMEEPQPHLKSSFGKALSSPCTTFRLEIPVKQFVFKVCVEVLSQNYCDLSLELSIEKMVVKDGDDAVMIPGDSEMLVSVSFTDLYELDECLSWAEALLAA